MWLVLWMPNISVCETFSPIHKFEVEKRMCVAFFVLEAFDFDKGDRFDGQWRPLRAQMDLEKTKGLVCFKKYSVKSKYLGSKLRIFKKLYYYTGAWERFLLRGPNYVIGKMRFDNFQKFNYV